MTTPRKQETQARVDGKPRRRRGEGVDRERQLAGQKEWSERRTAERKRKKKEAEDLGKIKDLLEANGVAADMIGSVRAVRLNEWEVAAKVGPKGGPKVLETKKLSAASIVLEPSWAIGPEYPLVQPAKPVVVRVPKRKSIPLVGTFKTAVLMPDTQIGYRRLANGDLDPFHDLRALDVAVQVLEAERPQRCVWLGDFLDLAPMSMKFRREPGFTMTVQPALDFGYELLAIAAELSGEMSLISGNHDIRLQNFIIENAQHAFGLRPGGTPPETWPDLSIQHLLRLDEVNCEYVGSYPAGATYINDNLAAIHGARIGNKSRTAAQMIVDDERVSVAHGHTHHHAEASKTRNSRGAPKFSRAYSPGCLCRIDGAVPSSSSNIDCFGRPVKQWEDWQQGVGVVRYQDGNGKFAIEHVAIFEGWATHRGQEFDAREDLQWKAA